VRRAARFRHFANRILVLDYRSLSNANEIESLGSVLFSTLSGKLYAVGGRAMVSWKITANSCTLAERSDALASISGERTGKRRGQRQNLSAFRHAVSDDGAAINSYYTTYFS